MFYLGYASLLVLAMLLFFVVVLNSFQNNAQGYCVYIGVVFIYIYVPSVRKQRRLLVKPIHFSYSIPSLVTLCFEQPCCFYLSGKSAGCSHDTFFFF